jgi:regulator of protease activity HflC (stomatin/prohibitin superfamily)
MKPTLVTRSRKDNSMARKPKLPSIAPIAIVSIFVVLFAASRCYKTVEAGYVSVATLFGNVRDEPYEEGLHFPVNPFYKWHDYDARKKTHKEVANVPSQDQLQTKLEVSIQYRLIGSQTPKILANTGLAQDVVNVHLIPKLRSLVREQGKSIRRAEDFFQEETQERLQVDLTAGMDEFMRPQGVAVEDVLIRDIQLPPFITKAIEAKKEREQEVEKQKAELERFRTEQQQKIALAEAERIASEQQAEQRRILADAQAYEIRKINEAVASNPAYIQLQALQALEQISKDPASKMYFMDGDSTMPLPLMHLGDRP